MVREKHLAFDPTRSSVLLSLSLRNFDLNQDLISARQWVMQGGVRLTGKVELGVICEAVNWISYLRKILPSGRRYIITILVHGLITPGLDYCNSLLGFLRIFQLLPRLQDIETRLG